MAFYGTNSVIWRCVALWHGQTRSPLESAEMFLKIYGMFSTKCRPSSSGLDVLNRRSFFSLQVMCLSETPAKARGSWKPCVRSYVSVMTTQRSWTSWHVSTTTWPMGLSRRTRGDLCLTKSRCPASWVCSPRSCTSRRSESCGDIVFELLNVKHFPKDPGDMIACSCPTIFIFY